MFWRKKSILCAGSVLFRGSIPPRPDDFQHLTRQGITVRALEHGNDVHWQLALAHPRYGNATLFCMREAGRPPKVLLDWARELVPSEKELAATGESRVILHMEASAGDLLRDRKNLLWFLRQIMADDGVVAVDHLSTRFWSRGALDDELCHDGDLDIESLFAVHIVTEDGERASWLHTHGLAGLGVFDFDILNPCSDLLGIGGTDVLRAIAFAIFEGGPQMIGKTFPLQSNGGMVRFVDAHTFDRRAAAAYRKIRDDPDGTHTENRAVVCDPPGRLLGRWLDRPTPARRLSAQLGDQFMASFSTAASQLMAQRARQTYSLFRNLRDELAEFGLPAIVKLRYGEDEAGESGEHMWFEVHELHDDKIDATLLSRPFYVNMSKGDRGLHPLERITDWSILTPAGLITPRNTTLARMVRENRDELLAAMQNKAQEA